MPIGYGLAGRPRTDWQSGSRPRVVECTEQGFYVGKHGFSLLGEVLVGVAAELVAAGPRGALAFVVLLPGVAGMVEAVAVELDREAGPAAVDVVGALAAVEPRQRD